MKLIPVLFNLWNLMSAETKNALIPEKKCIPCSQMTKENILSGDEIISVLPFLIDMS